jgi:2-keto-4-pentenoate hydratase
MKKIKIAAQALINARKTNLPLSQFPENSAPTSVGAAFDIQDEIIISKNAEIVAWKVGPGSKEFPPTCAPISREYLFVSPIELPKSLRLKAVECEVAFRLGVDLPANKGPYSPSQAKAAVETVMVAIEAVETRYNEWPVKDPIWALADSQSNEALIIGKEIALEALGSFSDFRATLSVGNVKKNADKGFPGGDPFSLIAWLANHLAERASVIAERGLKKGDVITTGSWNGVDFAKANEEIIAVFEGLGEAQLKYT